MTLLWLTTLSSTTTLLDFHKGMMMGLGICGTIRKPRGEITGKIMKEKDHTRLQVRQKQWINTL